MLINALGLHSSDFQNIWGHGSYIEINWMIIAKVKKKLRTEVVVIELSMVGMILSVCDDTIGTRHQIYNGLAHKKWVKRTGMPPY